MFTLSDLKIESLLEAYVAYKLDLITAWDVANWTANNLHMFEDLNEAPELMELLANLNGQVSPKDKNMRFVSDHLKRKWPGFTIDAPLAESVAKALFKQVLQKYISNPVKPCNVCTLASKIESIYKYPLWLGNIYAHCDWMEPDTKAKDVGYFYDGMKEILEQL